MTEVTPQQEVFCQLVAEGRTYFAAYQEAYPKSLEWKSNPVYVESSKMMANPKISIRVRELQEENKKKNQVTLSEVLEEMAAWLRFNPKSLHNEDGTLKQWSEITDEEAKCISEYQCEEIWGRVDGHREQIGTLKKIKLVDKRSTADMFMKKFGAYITNVKLDVEDLTHLRDLISGIKE